MWIKKNSENTEFTIHSALQSLKGCAGMVSGPPVSHAPSHSYIPSPGAFIPRLLYLRPRAGVTLTLLPRAPYEGKKVKPWLWLSTPVPHSDSVPSTFPLLSQPPHPLSTSEYITLKEPSVWDSLNICADPFDPQLVYHFILWGDEWGISIFPGFSLLQILSMVNDLKA